ncbi:hypothetical protein E3U55_12625 [Filobacillus milosensis]|uniref:Uncharacterized protein n=1 Tax=Filobacillus milosensis TaxID=94137 RepID=A0A4Y8IEW7_9BACI|nr:hypothetical protein [Filobacillus milosensis]TFB15090.1 hypothetical protein E3U55_12625 [Filobacillus milosensis]
MGEDHFNMLNNLIEELDDQTEKYVNQMKNRVSAIKESTSSGSVLCYFTYSFNISHCANKENIMLCSFNVINLSKKAVHNPYICLNIPTDQGFNMMGKIIQPNHNNLKNQSDAWERFTQTENNNEYWLRPVNNESIPPNERIKFSNFQIKWNAIKQYSASIKGYFYSDEYPNGLNAINGVSVNGNVEGRESNG